MKMGRGPFFHLLLLSFLCLSIFETAEICLESTKMEISIRKKEFHARKNHEVTLLKSIPLTPLGLEIFHFYCFLIWVWGMVPKCCYYMYILLFYENQPTFMQFYYVKGTSTVLSFSFGFPSQHC